MEFIRGFHNLRDHHRGCVLSIGNFDGLHLGHQALIRRLREHAQQRQVPACVQTFDPTAREFFDPPSAPPRVLTLRDKCRLLAQAGVQRLLCVRFDRRLAAMDATRYVEDILVARLGVRVVVVGEDFRFGAGRAGDLPLLQALGRQHGFVAEALGAVTLQGRRCSSTALRQALAEPDLQRAALLLGWPYALSGRVRPGLKLGRTLGMPTANITLRRVPALRYGVYAVRAQADDLRWEGVANIGVRPTLGLTRPLLEVHVFADTAPLYGRELRIEFCRYLRPERRFDSLDQLSAQMQADKAAAQAWFAGR
jgi:riboflavin kinase / FMN adenylyltransferase